MIRRSSSRRRSAPHVTTLLLTGVVSAGLSGCATVAGTVLSTAIHEIANGDRSSRGGLQAPGDVDLLSPSRPGSPSSFGPSSRDGGRPATVYVSGPVPGWERGPLLFGSSADWPFFAASPYRGLCRSLINVSFQDDDPFGPLRRPPVDLADMGNNLGISPDYVPFGRVMLGGAGPQHYQWEPMTLLARSGAGCDFLWFRLISFGKDEGVETIHR